MHKASTGKTLCRDFTTDKRHTAVNFILINGCVMHFYHSHLSLLNSINMQKNQTLSDH